MFNIGHFICELKESRMLVPTIMQQNANHIKVIPTNMLVFSPTRYHPARIFADTGFSVRFKTI